MAGHASQSVIPTTTKDSFFDNESRKDSVAAISPRQRETAQYISDMVLELRNLAKSVQLYQVMVPLEYAYYEAYGVANKVEPPAEEVARLRHLSRESELAEGGQADQE